MRSSDPTVWVAGRRGGFRDASETPAEPRTKPQTGVFPSKLRFVDTHAHLQFSEYDADRVSVLERMRSAGVATIAVGTDRLSSHRAVDLAGEQPNVWAAVGFHPHDLPRTEQEFGTVASLATDARVVAVGETGLDYFRSDDRDHQRLWFRRHLELAGSVGKVAIVHLRDRSNAFDAYDDALSILTEFPSLPFVLHCYSGDATRAKRALELGGMVSFTGILTFKNATLAREVARSVPLDRVLLETDAPYLAPEPDRGKRNEPAWVVRVAELLAELHGESVETVAAQTTTNARSIFKLP